MGSYDLDSAHTAPPPLDPNILSSDPALSVLRAQYLSRLGKKGEGLLGTNQDSQRSESNLRPTPSDLATFESLNVRQSLAEGFELLTSTSSHRRVMDTLAHVGVLLHTVHCVGGEGGRGLSYPEGVASLWISVAER